MVKKISLGDMERSSAHDANRLLWYGEGVIIISCEGSIMLREEVIIILYEGVIIILHEGVMIILYEWVIIMLYEGVISIRYEGVIIIWHDRVISIWYEGVISILYEGDIIVSYEGGIITLHGGVIIIWCEGGVVVTWNEGGSVMISNVTKESLSYGSRLYVDFWWIKMVSIAIINDEWHWYLHKNLDSWFAFDLYLWCVLDLVVDHFFFTLINPTQTNPEILFGTKFSRGLASKSKSKVVWLKGIGFP